MKKICKDDGDSEGGIIEFKKMFRGLGLGQTKIEESTVTFVPIE